MCGIAGIIQNDHTTGRDVVRAEALLMAMLATMVHRGPEASRVGSVDHASLAHCLLSFTERPYPQPVFSPCRKVALVLNGEVYNLRELARKHHRTEADTEGDLLLASYLEEGPAFVAGLRGMFALAIADARVGRTILARDPFGKKPLYYLQTREGVVFASELRALMMHPDCPRDPDPDAVARYLCFNAVPAPFSIFKGAHKLRAGTWIEFGSNGFKHEQCYWRLPEISTVFAMPQDRAIGKLEDLLVGELERRLYGSTQLFGVALSGGLDSSILAALARSRLGRRLPAFTVGFQSESFDETHPASIVASHLGLEHHIVRLSGRQLADTVIREYGLIDEPLADQSMIPMLVLCALAQKHVKGLVGGDGADEVFMGYQFFRASMALYKLERWVPPRLAGVLRSLCEHLPVRYSNLHPSTALRMLGRAIHSPRDLLFYNATGAFTTAGVGRVLTPSSASVDVSRLTDELDGFRHGFRGNHLEELQRSIICHFLRDVILSKVDRSSMLHSIEVRSPFLDLELIEWTMLLPLQFKFHKGQGKRILRVLAKRFLPPEIVSRQKQGFRAPVAQLLREELRDLVIDTLSEQIVGRVGLVEPCTVARIVDEHLKGRRDHQKQLWSLLCLHIWHQHFVNTRPAIHRDDLELRSHGDAVRA